MRIVFYFTLKFHCLISQEVKEIRQWNLKPCPDKSQNGFKLFKTKTKQNKVCSHSQQKRFKCLWQFEKIRS